LSADAGSVLIPVGAFFARVDVRDVHLVARFRWHAQQYKRSSGAVNRYAKTSLAVDGKKTRQFMHRVVLGLSPSDGGIVDHINGDGLDNRRANLRFATQSQNLANKRSVANRTGFKGVRLRLSGRFEAACGGKRLGCYDTAREAARAYNTQAVAMFGQFAATNRDLGLLP